MDKIISDFNKLYPAFAAVRVNSKDLDIIESENSGKPNTFQTLTIKNVTGWVFSKEFLESTKSFHSKAQRPPIKSEECHDIMMRECDGMFCREEDGKIVFHLFELKSTFNTEELAKAKNQITGSYLKMRHLLNPLQLFGDKEISMKGHIVIYEPSTEQLSAIIKLMSDPKNRFSIRIHDEKRYEMPADKCSRYWHPLACTDISLELIEVPFGTTSHQISL